MTPGVVADGPPSFEAAGFTIHPRAAISPSTSTDGEPTPLPVDRQPDERAPGPLHPPGRAPRPAPGGQRGDATWSMRDIVPPRSREPGYAWAFKLAPEVGLVRSCSGGMHRNRGGEQRWLRKTSESG